MKISVIGLGKLGACSAACFAAKGHQVIGVDINQSFVDAINSGKAPFVEPQLQETITSAKGRLSATTDFSEALNETDITMLIVPTPSRPDGNFSDDYLQDALGLLARAFKTSNKSYHLFVITSTVTPGTTEKNLIPLIEKISGKKLNKDFGVCYNPEFIALGSVVKDFLNPDILLIGESDKRAGDMLAESYKNVCESNPYYARMSIISAEIAKISLNSFITLKISFANTLARICEAVPDSNIDDITKALGADRRISPFYLKGGLSYGGPCFPRDNRAFAAFASNYGIETELAATTDRVNSSNIKHVAEKIIGILEKSNCSRIAVLGLSYKPDTCVIEESPATKLIDELLKKKKIEITVYDPLAIETVRAVYGEKLHYAESIRECLDGVSLGIVTTQAKELKSIDSSCIGNSITIIDCWRQLDPARLGPKVKYLALGRWQ